MIVCFTWEAFLLVGSCDSADIESSFFLYSRLRAVWIEGMEGADVSCEYTCMVM